MPKSTALSIKDLAVNGNDLMTSGIPAGKTMGKILTQLLEAVMEDPEQNTKEKLTEIDYFCLFFSSRETKLTKNH